MQIIDVILEIIQNSLVHGKAHNIKLKLEGKKLSIIDDGTSFDLLNDMPSVKSNGNGIGKASYYSADGDSGGLVFTYNMSTNTGYTVGIHYGLGDGEAVYTKASVDNAALGITRY